MLSEDALSCLVYFHIFNEYLCRDRLRTGSEEGRRAKRTVPSLLVLSTCTRKPDVLELLHEDLLNHSVQKCQKMNTQEI